ncbi:NUDIX hydrolase [Aspergillus puulaauensis]|uniref:Nudix hydrolase domain-containing protein n=1 Tax=Aspergillus puulaauensis TaxID=1220207 RepID=A0A7R7XSJ9_9EURO|nr:uncharacterized protein APUU_60004A [Aspergillus puulaauensis]BCS26956.1 hypothetical protein APUU_60004A [Aspergillus puulaauensis]
MRLQFNYTVATHLAEFSCPFPAFCAQNPEYTHFIGGALIFSPKRENVSMGATPAPHEEDGAGQENQQQQQTPRVLLLQRAFHNSFPGAWEVPGGLCEEDDRTLLDGVAREVFEECGLRVSRFVELVAKDAWDIPRPDLGLTHTLVKYTFLVEVHEVETGATAIGDHGYLLENVGVNGENRRGCFLTSGEAGISRGRRWEDRVVLSAQEHCDYRWAMETEVRRGLERGTGLFALFTRHGHQVLEGFHAWKRIWAGVPKPYA